MKESKFIETLFERYRNNQATNRELKVFMDLLKQGKLDELAKTYMDQEAESLKAIIPGFSTTGGFKP